MHSADPLAERMLLALVLSGHPQPCEKFAKLPLEVFTRGVHRAVAGALRDAIARGNRVHPPSIAAEATRRADTVHKGELINQFVLDAGTSAPATESFDYYARLLLEHTRLRAITEAGQRITQITSTDDLDLSAMTTHLRGVLDDLDQAAGVVAAAPPISLQELLDEPAEPYDWLVPGLLERMDRLMITAYEGVGKSMLLAQFAAATAAGLHPFAGVPMRQAFRVLVLDCENPRSTVKRRYRQVQQTVNAIRERHGLDPVDWYEQMRMELHPGGIDLTQPRECARIEERVAAAAPDLVVAGPLYQMHRRDTNEETAARDLVANLDRLRVRYQFTLICEAHSPHGEGSSGKRKLRPAGSSLFLRWPEFGYGLRPSGDTAGEEHPSLVELAAWRGSRDQRHWPELLQHGGRGELPWKPANASYWRENLRAVN